MATITTNTTNTTATTKRPEGITKAVWENDTFRVYNGLVKLVKGEITLSQFVNHPTVKSVCEYCNITKGLSDKDAIKVRGLLTVNLIITMAKDRTSKGEKERHIAPIYRLRSFFNGEYKSKASLPVTYKAPASPKAPAKKTSPKGKKASAPKTPAKKFSSADEFVKSLPADKLDELRVAIATMEMGLEEVA